MGSEIQSKKRKAVSPQEEVIKVKKVKQIAPDKLPKKRKDTGDADPITNKKLKNARLDPLERALTKSTKKGHPIEGKKLAGNDVNPPAGKIKSSRDVIGMEQKLSEIQDSDVKKNKHGKSKKPKEATSLPAYVDEGFPSSSELAEEEIDDQTDALLKGFESSDEEEKDPKDRGYEAGEEIPKVDMQIRKEAKAAEISSSSDKRGVVYVGRIPHGFYEQEMRQYFSQFGTITNLRLSRNRKTGRSKHFAFIEFESAEVAVIVSKTMDNYPLFGHILKCKMVAPEQVHENLWVGANRSFKRVPWNKIEGRKLQQGMTKEGWNKRIEREERRRAEKRAALLLMDYEFESPKLKSAKDIPKKGQLLLTPGDEPDDEGPTATEVSKEMEDQKDTAKVKKSKKKISAKDTRNGKAEEAGDVAPMTKVTGTKIEGSIEKSPELLLGATGQIDSVPVQDTTSRVSKKAEKSKKGKKNKISENHGAYPAIPSFAHAFVRVTQL